MKNFIVFCYLLIGSHLLASGYMVKMGVYKSHANLVKLVNAIDDKNYRDAVVIEHNNGLNYAISKRYPTKQSAKAMLFACKKVFRDAYITRHKSYVGKNHTPNNTKNKNSNSNSSLSSTLNNYLSSKVESKKQYKSRSRTYSVKFGVYRYKKNIQKLINRVKNTKYRDMIHIEKKGILHYLLSEQFDTKYEANKMLRETRSVFGDAYVISSKNLQIINQRADTALENNTINYSNDINFKQSSKVYHKFGTSELHGKVTYIDKNMQETSLQNTHIYLITQSRGVDRWYNNSYLKNKTNKRYKKDIIFENKTYLNLDKRFSFFGISAGTYYVIVESENIQKNNDSKTYIVQKIKIGKYKKILTIFNKKL